MTNHDHTHPPRPGFFRTPTGWIITVVLLGLAVYLWVAHQAHVLAALPILVLLLCPLMHVFMHRGHGHGHNRPKDDT